MPPPPLPAESLRKVMRASLVNGGSVAVIAGVAALASLVFGDWLGFLVGALAACCGGMELYGRRMVARDKDASGCRYMMWAQLGLIVVICSYACLRLIQFDATDTLRYLPAQIWSTFEQAGIGAGQLEAMLTKMSKLLYGLVIGLTLLYQGRMFFYYRNRQESVALALESED